VRRKRSEALAYASICNFKYSMGKKEKKVWGRTLALKGDNKIDLVASA